MLEYVESLASRAVPDKSESEQGSLDKEPSFTKAFPQTTLACMCTRCGLSNFGHPEVAEEEVDAASTNAVERRLPHALVGALVISFVQRRERTRIWAGRSQAFMAMTGMLLGVIIVMFVLWCRVCLKKKTQKRDKEHTDSNSTVQRCNVEEVLPQNLGPNSMTVHHGPG